MTATQTNYVSPPAARFRVETDAREVERIVIRAQRSLPAMVALSVWLTLWAMVLVSPPDRTQEIYVFFAVAGLWAWMAGGSVWQAMWAVIALWAFSHLLGGLVDRVVPFWMWLWLAGGASGGIAWLWLAFGEEVVAVVDGDLVASARLFGVSRRRRYRGADIRALSASPASQQSRGVEIPLLWAPEAGAVTFSYGERSAFAAVGLDETEGRAIVEILARRLPSARE